MTERKERPIVVAGNYREFLNWCFDNQIDPREALYVSEFHVLKGMTLKASQIFRTGTFYMRDDLHQIENEILMSTKR